MPVLQGREGHASMLCDEMASTVARRLGALAEPTRLKLAMELRRRDKASVQELATAVGGSLPNVSKHLQVLHQNAIVSRHKEGTFVHYRLAGDHVSALVGYSVMSLGARRARERR
jgi:DNA-binding transcriptional ArsR family regulator